MFIRHGAVMLAVVGFKDCLDRSTAAAAFV
jgi:hypothetical protein